MSSDSEAIVVCQVPMCFAMGGEYRIGEHQYWYCDEHALAWGWCSSCDAFVGRRNIHSYGLCASCLETVPMESAAALAATIDEMLDEMPQCPHCEGIDIVITHDGGYCNSCNQMFDAAVAGDS